jgi:hypothetical protein
MRFLMSRAPDTRAYTDARKKLLNGLRVQLLCSAFGGKVPGINICR